MILEKQAPIAIFDSGVGGLSVLIEIRKILPYEKIIYLTDKKRHPFGTRSKNEIEKITDEIINFLISKNAKLIVIACNTASTVKLNDLRAKYNVPIIGMIEPEVISQYINEFTGKLAGLIGTKATVRSKAYNNVINKLNSKVNLYSKSCSELVPLIESGEIEDNNFMEELKNCLSPLLKVKITELIIGCTHFSFIIKKIKDLLGSNIKLFDPSRYVAQFVMEKLSEKKLLNNSKQIYEPEYLVTAKKEEFITSAQKMTLLILNDAKLITI